MKYFFCCLVAAAQLLVGIAAAAEPAILAKARAYLGGDAALNGVTSVHMVGSMVVEMSNDSARPSAQIDIIFQKPWQERVTIVTADQLSQTGLDDYDAWHREQKRTAGAPLVFDLRQAMKFSILGPDQIWGLRTDTWENLYYYRGLDDAGGETKDLGAATIDGISCEKVALIHSPQIVYYRYFDTVTGRLVYSETLKGAKIREQGEIIASGIRFPKAIVVEEAQGDKVRKTSFTVETVSVNESFPASTFTVPPLPLPVDEPARNDSPAPPLAAPAPKP